MLRCLQVRSLNIASPVAGVTLIAAGVLKLLSHSEVAAIWQARMPSLPFSTAVRLIESVASVEFVTGAALLAPAYRDAARLPAGAISLAIAGLAIRDLTVGEAAGCGCFGGIASLESVPVRMVFATILALGSWRHISTTTRATGPASRGDAAGRPA